MSNDEIKYVFQVPEGGQGDPCPKCGNIMDGTVRNGVFNPHTPVLSKDGWQCQQCDDLFRRTNMVAEPAPAAAAEAKPERTMEDIYAEIDKQYAEACEWAQAGGFSVRKIRVYTGMSEETWCFEATVWRGNKQWGWAQNRGHGGETLVRSVEHRLTEEERQQLTRFVDAEIDRHMQEKAAKAEARRQSRKR